MQFSKDITSLIGKTPLVKINGLNLPASIYAKVEMFNPLSSVKDRAVFYMLKAAFESGALAQGGTVTEPTSGNTGIALAALGRIWGLKVILAMPETMSVERQKLLKLLGARLELTPGPKGMRGAIERAEEIASAIPGCFMPGQFANPANAQAHFETTGPEIWQALGGKVDFLVAGVGTGGTVTGCGGYLKKQNPALKVIAVEPAASPVLSGGKPGPHKIQGIGAGFVPPLLDVKIIDEIIKVEDAQAFEGARLLREQEGLFCGVSSGAALSAAAAVAGRSGNEGKNIAVVLPDTGERYLSML
jgi:cysteine synthase A